jgi:LPXTG-motif cell wall-anchored protein
MSGQTPKVLSATTGAVLLPNTGGSHIVFWVAIAALGLGILALAFSGAASLKQRINRA